MHFLNSVTLFLTVVPIFCELRVRQGWTEQAPIGRGPRQEHSVTAIGTDVVSYICGAISPSIV